MSSFSYKGILSILVSVFLVSSIVYASSTIISVQTQSIAQGDVIANGWFQEVNDSIVSIRNTLTSNTGNLWGKSGNDIYYTGGNVGIGMMSPVAPLHINRISNNLTHGYATDLILEAQHPSIQFKGHSDSNLSAYIGYDAQIGGAQIPGLRFWTGESGDNHGGTYMSKMTILNNGNVGIGTPSPQIKLDVNGQIRFNKADITRADAEYGGIQFTDFDGTLSVVPSVCSSGWCCSVNKKVCLSAQGQLNISLMSSFSSDCIILHSEDDVPSWNKGLVVATDGGNDCSNTAIGRPLGDNNRCIMIEKDGVTTSSPIVNYQSFKIACF